jgi:pSer/pThr/pTyr-binding forkhead associated (FHA) protein
MKLIILQNDNRMDTPLRNGLLTLGRSRDCDIQLSHHGISRKHLSFEIEDNCLRVRDLGSRNGFKVKGRKTDETLLKHNEEFSVGDVIFIFQTHDDDLPVATLPSDDQTPIDTQFVPQKEDEKVLPAVKSSKAIVALPVREMPAYRKTKSRSKNLLIASLIPIVLLLIVLVIKIFSSSPPPSSVNATKQAPSSPASLENMENYQKICAEALKVFEVYFKNPSRYNSRLKEALNLLNPALSMKKFSKVKTAPELSGIMNLFNDVGIDWNKITPNQLTRLLTHAQNLEADRRSSFSIKNFAQNLSTWAYSQLAAFNQISDLRENAKSSDLETLLTTWKQLRSLEKDHIYAPLQEKMETQLFKDIGDEYLRLGKEFYRKNNFEEARKMLNKAQDFGHRKEAGNLLKDMDLQIFNAELFDKATQAYENDLFDSALNFLEKIKNSRFEADIDQLRYNIAKRRYLLQLREAFSNGNEDLIGKLIDNVPELLMRDSGVNHMIENIDATIAAYYDALDALDENQYDRAKTLLYEVIDNLPKFDTSNHYKVQAQEILKDLAPEKIAQKHYLLGVEAMAYPRTDYVKSRREFDIARNFEPEIAKDEIANIVEQANDKFIAFLTTKARGDAKSIKEAIADLRKVLRWLRPQESQKEADLYKKIQKQIRNNN